MKILWLSNVILPQIAEKLGLQKGVMCGWLNDLADYLDDNENIELNVVAPQSFRKETVQVQWGKKSYFWGIYIRNISVQQYDNSLEAIFQDVIREIQPDIVHIFGTEYMHSLAMVRAFHNPNRTVIHIQGLVSVYANHYCAYLPYKTVYGGVFSHLFRRQEIPVNKRIFEERGILECDAIAEAGHVMGRTDWDCACAKRMNREINYHHVEEVLRSPFYEGRWKQEHCVSHRIFMTQGTYPIKGLHIALEAVAILMESFPDVKLCLGGSDIYSVVRKTNGRVYSYEAYIHDLIGENHLQENIVFCGSLTAEEVKRHMLMSNVFILPSSIENSSNSLGEAALLGVPIVASYVGGTPSIIEHGRTGLLYPADEPYMLAYDISEIFENPNMAEQLSENAAQMAHARYDREKGFKDVISVYHEMTR